MATTPEQFHNRGRDIVTQLAKAMDDFRAYARVFEIRGGALGMDALDPEGKYGVPTEGLVVLHNDLVSFLGQNGRQQLLDKYRTDY